MQLTDGLLKVNAKNPPYGDVSISFGPQTWNYFERSQIIGRLKQWQSIADADSRLRGIEEWSETDNRLDVRLSPLPDGFVSLADFGRDDSFSDADKAKAFASLLDTLGYLHANRFYMGFLPSDIVFVHPESLRIVLSVQPFTSVYPFLNYSLPDYSYELFSPFGRTYAIHRISDFYAAGSVMPELFGERVRNEGLQTLYKRLTDKPDYLFIEEAANDIRGLFELDRTERLPDLGSDPHAWLYPAEPPITAESQWVLRRFLQAEGGQRISIFHEDESLVAETLRFHMNEALETQIFITVKCTDVPFSTIQEMLNRTIYGFIRAHAPEYEMPFSGLANRLQFLIQQYYFGKAVFGLFVEWLLHFYEEFMAVVGDRNVYIVFDECSGTDKESLVLFDRAWNRNKEKMPRLFIIFSGAVPENDYLFAEDTYRVKFLGKEASSYAELMLRQLRRADSRALAPLAEWLSDKETDPKHTPPMLKAFIDQGLLSLSREGWTTGTLTAPLEGTNPYSICAAKLKALDDEEMRILALFCCLPTPIRAWNLFKANGLPLERLLSLMQLLAERGLILLFHQNSIFVPKEIKEMMDRLPYVDLMNQAYMDAFTYMSAIESPSSLRMLRLAQKSGNDEWEYTVLMLYFRRHRKSLSSEQMRMALEWLINLNSKLGRRVMPSLYRLILPVYDGFRELKRCEETCEELVRLGIRDGDRFKLMFYKMMQDELDLSEHKAELLDYLRSPRHKLSDKLDAMCILVTNRSFLELEPQDKQFIKDFYTEHIYPNRHLIQRRDFIYVSYYFIGFIFDYYPDLNDWNIALLNKLESLLHYFPYPDLILRVYNMYIHQKNYSKARPYLEKVIHGAIQLGNPYFLEVGHINAMEISLLLGEMTAFHYHRNRVGEVKRKDLLEVYRDVTRMYACEWRNWELDEELGRVPETSDYAKTRLELNRSYAAYLKGSPIPDPAHVVQEPQIAMFIEALRCVEDGQITKACTLFRQCSGVRYSMLEGWAYREMLLVMLRGNSESADIKVALLRFKRFIETDAFHIFWPDYYYISGIHALRAGDRTEGLLLLRRAINGYYMIQKDGRFEETKQELEAYLVPEGLPASWELADDPHVRRILEERRDYIERSLNYLTTIRLFDYLPNSLDLTKTMDRVNFAIFEYYPIVYVTISFDLSFKKSREYYSAFGPIHGQMLEPYRLQEGQLQKFSFTLFSEKTQSIRMDVFMNHPKENDQLEQLLQMIKPHIANAVLNEQMMIDGLTGLYTRKSFMEMLEQEVAIFKTYGHDLSLLMIDLDDFRKVNEFGHHVGDAVLRQVADSIRSMLGQHDIAGRYGGEELVVILPKTDGRHALLMASDIRKQIELEFGGPSKPYQVTASIGVASMELCHADSADELIRCADAAEIQAKKTGKNKVVAVWANA
ncbi:GGDEF domain-containing protein [Cohnella endophytica]|uniref:GGDEF domain-containing protein n=1 Tax=Cohnella endophytica TaxID=2419778 RepID=A0A494XH40_9BACL|nr:GGDEF domain-containing protein [Cohnella endophytica]RKP49848.1 GGDEF domain-containing protein [Cohnella endophytica]